MLNVPVPAAATGLPSRPSSGAIMRQAHAAARAADARLPYAARLAAALRQAWRTAKRTSAFSFRRLVEGYVERLIAILDAIAGDPDLEDDDQEDVCEDDGAYDADLGVDEDEGAGGGVTTSAAPAAGAAARHAACQLDAIMARRSANLAVRP